ncbi:type IV pilus assembly protein PilQ [Thermodesulfovibrio aggregans]|uniref:Type IV pilus assembly protein PilQ n=1 Tax=Thermodesulfovibrio aggregans TaxID=86166 RepID=A0A0U9HS48_9BACT|nr:type IV pilus secretin PilQ [Thermodesulfovibrio aggregans]GAQ95652.1 type IV pilus assembly protein PilQ [Thermodesulfovibrio aggregans]
MINIIVFILMFLFISVNTVFAGEVINVIPEGDTLKIKLTEKTEFTLLPSEDPFKIKIELKNTKPGILDKKIFFREGIVSEISAQAKDNNTELLLLISEPAKAEIAMENGIMTISFNSTPAKPSKTVKIIEMAMDKNDEGFEISIQADDELPVPSVSKIDDYINVSFHGVSFEAETQDIPVSVKREGDELTLSFFFGKDFNAESVYLGDEVIINVKRAKKPQVVTSEEKKVTESPMPKIDTEKTVSLDLQDADIVGVFRLLGDIGGYNIVIHPEVKGKITVKLINVPWIQALDVICKTFQLEKTFDGNIIRVAPVKVFQEEKKLEAETKDLFKKAEDEQIRIFVLKYASVDKVKSTIESAKILSPKGNISTDERTRTVIVRDIPSVLNQVTSLIQDLDKPTRQILLEARIIEISSSFAKALGFEWGIAWRPPDTRTTIGGSLGGNVPGGSTPLAINLPASSGTQAPTTAFTIGYLNASRTFALDLRISALQQSGKGKVISNPKVITLDNQKAKIVQGASIPYGEKDVQSGQISTKFKDVAITVEATPHLIDDKSMLLDVNIIKEDLVEFVNIGGVYAPRTQKIEGNTKVSLRDGETLVIGGIYKKTDTTTESKVPGLGDIPLVGELFKSRGRDESLYEVMIFITPRIMHYE